MKHLNIPFQIGQEYENWEFDLEVLPDRIKGYDSYLYVGKEFNYFLNYCTDKTELIFHWDRLDAVILTFLNIEMNTVEEFKNLLKYHYPIYELQSNYEVYEYYKGNLQIILLFVKPNTLLLIYGNSISLGEIHSSILEEILE